MPLKKALPLLFISALVLAATTGCTTKTTETTKNVSGGTAATNAGVDVSIVSLGTKASLGTFIKADEGKTFAVYNVTVKNLNAKDRNINEFYFKLRDTDGIVYTVDLGSTAANGAMKAVTDTQPGDIVKGTIAFEIPQGATPKTVTYDDNYDKITFNV
jgi:hypothetical protein